MKKLLLTSFAALVFCANLQSQNITNTLPSNGSFIVKDATNTFFTLLQSTGNVGIGSNVFDPVNPEKLLIDAGTTNSVNAIYAKGSINSYFQINIRNLSNGNQSSSDLVATANNGTETTNFMDIGINGSNYVYQPGNPIETGGPNDGYIISAGKDFYLVNNCSNKDMVFLTGGTASSNERMRIKSGGNIGIGFSNPGNYRLYVSGNGFITGNWYNSSDVRYKKDIQPLTNTLEKILKLRGVSFKFVNDSTGKTNIGFIAQEMEEIFPELVSTGTDGYKGVSYTNVTAVLLESIKEQQAIIDSQQKEIDRIKEDIQLLKSVQGPLTGSNAGNSDIGHFLLFSFLIVSTAAVAIKLKKKRS